MTNKIAWVLSLISSGILSIYSLNHVYKYISYPLEYTYYYWSIETDLMIWFYILYMILDLGIGFIFYRNEMDLMTGWLHHIYYIMFFVHVLRKDIAFMTNLIFLEEIPTLIMSIGKVIPYLRNDLLFGLSFLFTRIVYHSYLIYKVLKCNICYYLSVPLLIALGMHFYWFYKWCNNYIYKYN